MKHYDCGPEERRHSRERVDKALYKTHIVGPGTVDFQSLLFNYVIVFISQEVPYGPYEGTNTSDEVRNCYVNQQQSSGILNFTNNEVRQENSDSSDNRQDATDGS